MKFKWLVISAIVTLVDGNEADRIVQTLNSQKLLDTTVTVAVCPSEKLLCVAHLPFSLTEEEFRVLVAGHGPVECCFLMTNSNGKCLCMPSVCE